MCSGCRQTSAARVAEALGLALGAGERERLAERPTENLAAYDAFLKGEAGDRRARRATSRRSGGRSTTTSARWPLTPPSPSPGPSSRGRTRASTVATPTAAGAAAARQAAERALALAPKLPEGYSPWRTTTTVVQQDSRGAHEQCQTGVAARAQGRPVPGSGRQRTSGALGHAEEGLEHLREGAGTRSPLGRDCDNTVWALVGLRRYPEALEAAKRGGSRSPQPTSG